MVLVTGSSCGLSLVPNERLVCSDKNTLMEETYCVNKRACQGEAGAKLLCSWVVETDEDHEDNFDAPGSAVLGGTCDAGAKVNSYPPSACDGSGDEGGSISATASTSETGSATSEPATSGDPTEGPQMPLWLCSRRSELMCANLDIDDALDNNLGKDPYPDNTNRDACWAPVETELAPAKKISHCVSAQSESAALSLCEANCGQFNDWLEMERCPALGCMVSAPVDCVLSDANDPQKKPALAAENTMIWTCSAGTEDGMLLAWGEQSGLTLFEGLAAMVLSNGTYAGVSSLGGYLGYRLTDCNTATCTITVDALESLTRHIEGTYTDVAGGGGDYEFEDVGFRAKTAFAGTWYKARRTVAFPDTSVEAVVWGGQGWIDGAGLWVGAQTIEIDQITGSLASANDPLTLNFAFNWSDGTVTMSVATLSD